MSLSAEQAAAARAGPDGAFLIAAGPGTGKTFTMVERFAWLVNRCGVPAGSILAVTFTDRAAAELRERVGAVVDLPDDAWVSTFHGTCARLLRENAYLLGVPRDLRVLDDIGQRLLLDRLQSRLRSGAEAAIDPEQLTALQPDDLNTLLRHGLQFVLKLKGRGITPDQFRERALTLHGEHEHQQAGQLSAAAEEEAIRVLHAVYASYESWLARSGLLDFDDLVLTTSRALREVPEFRAHCRSLFRYLLVDEFQDSNRIQLELVRLLAADAFANVAVVGDAKQSIYGWRDAEIENIRSRFPGLRLPLTHNRRSHQEMLDLATWFIRRDAQFSSEPELVAERGPGGPDAVTVVMAGDPAEEARLVVDEICRLHERGERYRDIAILAHSVRRLPYEFERELRRRRIPYVTSGGAGLFDREEVKDVLALLRLTQEPLDDAALVRVLQGPVVRMDDAVMYRLSSRRFGRRGMRLRDCWDDARAGGFQDLAAPVAERAERLLQVVDRLGADRDSLTVADVMNRLLEETGYLRHAQLRALREGPRSLLNLRKIFQMANDFEREAGLAGLSDFVHQLDHLVDAEVPIGEAEMTDSDAVSVLTIHSAKGLEFANVFVVNTRPTQVRDQERLFFDPDGFGFVMKYWRGEKHPRYEATAPSSAALELARQERRRLAYVAMTRAADRLYVSATRSEERPDQVVAAEDDHFSEVLSWAVANPGSARVLTAEQLALELPQGTPTMPGADRGVSVERITQRLQTLVRPVENAVPVAMRDLRLSFSQLQLFELCPVRYRFGEIWQVPAPPDELLPAGARKASSASELGDAVHAALRAYHEGAAPDLLGAYQGPEDGAEMLRRYLLHPLASAPTLGVEVEFNLQLRGARVRGIVDRVCEYQGRAAIVDYKTNRSLDARLLEAYAMQLRLYGLAGARGLLPAETARLFIFDLRRGNAIEIDPDASGTVAWVEAAAGEISAGNFELGPKHRDRPCHVCAYRPLCSFAR